MTLATTPEHTAVADAIGQWSKKVSVITTVRAGEPGSDVTAEPWPALFRELAELGVFAAAVPERKGGMDALFVDLAVMLRADRSRPGARAGGRHRAERPAHVCVGRSERERVTRTIDRGGGRCRSGDLRSRRLRRPCCGGGRARGVVGIRRPRSGRRIFARRRAAGADRHRRWSSLGSTSSREPPESDPSRSMPSTSRWSCPGSGWTRW